MAGGAQRKGGAVGNRSKADEIRRRVSLPLAPRQILVNPMWIVVHERWDDSVGVEPTPSLHLQAVPAVGHNAGIAPAQSRTSPQIGTVLSSELLFASKTD